MKLRILLDILAELIGWGIGSPQLLCLHRTELSLNQNMLQK